MSILDLKTYYDYVKSELDKGSSATALRKQPEFIALKQAITSLPVADRKEYGELLNQLSELLRQGRLDKSHQQSELPEIDVTAPRDVNSELPSLNPDLGSIHPLMQAQAEMIDICSKMGFTALESRQLDNEFYMFDSLNFPEQHPARDEFDTFFLKNSTTNKFPLLAPAHTSAMQNRVLKAQQANLTAGDPIAAVVAGRAFRNEDVDSSHDHMFYQFEGIYVDKQVSVAHLLAVLKEFLTSYFKTELKIKTQPFYFPFTEPSFEVAMSCPFCQNLDGCSVCGQGFIEILGCGMIHPNVLKLAGIDSQVYTGFAWGMGINRVVMIKNRIQDIRHFTSGKLEFLRQFRYEG